jgi:valyl-tRNA synthetase
LSVQQSEASCHYSGAQVFFHFLQLFLLPLEEFWEFGLVSKSAINLEKRPVFCYSLAMNDKLLKPYNPQETEDAIYKKWEESGLFNPETSIKKGFTKPDAEPFSIVLPPPNVTGTLHIGHASMLAIEDSMVRFNRMRGKRTLWIPGTDHAAIATQSKVEKDLEKNEGKRKNDLGREQFLKRVEEFAEKSHDTIVNQIRKMGSSVDWSREAYTLDTQRSLAVRTAFKKMYDAGLIYRGSKIINWDPKGQTTISDDEIVYETRKAKLYTFKYSKDFPIAISTTRPETKVGDTAVAVHPSDERYQKYIDKEYDIVFAGVPIHIKIIADEAVEKEFGTGALGVTPAHSFVDAEIATRHNLPRVQVINEFAKMIVGGENLRGKKVSEARKIIVDWLKTENLLEEEKDIEQNIATAERSGGIIEPLPKLQWFIDVNKKITIPHSTIQGIASGSVTSLKELMKAAVENGHIKIIPERFQRVYHNWIENLHDWCISRQIWYGHRIPVWYRSTPLTAGRDEIYVDVEPPKDAGWTQDEDTLDTWFSSGLWTFSTLGWPFDYAQGKPQPNSDLEIYHPTSVLETGYDIIFFWVARMILMSTYLLGDIPFKTVYLHGLVRDAQGRKMSKSLGNIIDPLDLIEKYGADATRLSLIIGTGPGNDSKLSEDKVKAYKHFANKIWNASRFVLSVTEGVSLEQKPELMGNDAEALLTWNDTLIEITHDIENYRFYLAGEKLYHYFWHTFADSIIEGSKEAVYKGDEKTKRSAQWTLLYILTNSLKTLHPFMPFVTEEIWNLMGHTHFLMVESWPI